MGVDYEKVTDPSMDRSGADVRYALDCSKTENLGWSQAKTFDSSLADTIEYYREKMSGKL